MKSTNVKNGIYQHFKGDKVEVIGEALHSETLEKFVIYKHISGEKAREDHYWVRPENMFFEKVECDGKKFPRFKFVEK